MTKYEIVEKETSGVFDQKELDITGLSEAMDIYAKQVAIAFHGYEERFRKEQYIITRKAYEKAGGMFSSPGTPLESIYDDFINRKPIKCNWLGVNGQWELDENDKLNLIHNK
jgi:hypothetical protein